MKISAHFCLILVILGAYHLALVVGQKEPFSSSESVVPTKEDAEESAIPTEQEAEESVVPIDKDAEESAVPAEKDAEESVVPTEDDIKEKAVSTKGGDVGSRVINVESHNGFNKAFTSGSAPAAAAYGLANVLRAPKLPNGKTPYVYIQNAAGAPVPRQSPTIVSQYTNFQLPEEMFGKSLRTNPQLMTQLCASVLGPNMYYETTVGYCQKRPFGG